MQRRIQDHKESQDAGALVENLQEHARPIEPGDVCPICQDDLYQCEQPVISCHKSCGNSMHTKCLRILLDHYVHNQGQDIVKCPLCRKPGFGSVDEIRAQLKGSENARKEKTKRDKIRHYGSSCNECQKSPITGYVFRCTACTVSLILSPTLARTLTCARRASREAPTRSILLKQGWIAKRLGLQQGGLCQPFLLPQSWNSFRRAI